MHACREQRGAPCSTPTRPTLAPPPRAALPGVACRDALAAARMLGRTLIVPPVWCWCDYDEHPHILYRCRIK